MSEKLNIRITPTEIAEYYTRGMMEWASEEIYLKTYKKFFDMTEYDLTHLSYDDFVIKYLRLLLKMDK